MPKLTTYKNGEKFDQHLDSISHNSKARNKKDGCLPYSEGYFPNRIITILIYLNTLQDKDGGKTVFPNQNIKIKP